MRPDIKTFIDHLPKFEKFVEPEIVINQGNAQILDADDGELALIRQLEENYIDQLDEQKPPENFKDTSHLQDGAILTSSRNI